MAPTARLLSIEDVTDTVLGEDFFELDASRFVNLFTEGPFALFSWSFTDVKQ